jgi:hypothetical protein
MRRHFNNLHRFSFLPLLLRRLHTFLLFPSHVCMYSLYPQTPTPPKKTPSKHTKDQRTLTSSSSRNKDATEKTSFPPSSSLHNTLLKFVHSRPAIYLSRSQSPSAPHRLPLAEFQTDRSIQEKNKPRERRGGWGGESLSRAPHFFYLPVELPTIVGSVYPNLFALGVTQARSFAIAMDGPWPSTSTSQQERRTHTTCAQNVRIWLIWRSPKMYLCWR